MIRFLIILLMFQLSSFSQTGEDYYYGFGVKKDFKKAFLKFKKEKEFGYLITMYLNGDFVKKNPKKL